MLMMNNCGEKIYRNIYNYTVTLCYTVMENDMNKAESISLKEQNSEDCY